MRMIASYFVPWDSTGDSNYIHEAKPREIVAGEEAVNLLSSE